MGKVNPLEDPKNKLNGAKYHTGKKCVERGCTEKAGTAWSPYWCQSHNADRLGRIDNSLKKLTKKED